MFCQQLINRIKHKCKNDREGVALFIVLTAMATLAIFLGEITYTAQINQKLAYDRLDQVKAVALAKSGLRLGLLRVRAYKELQKMMGTAKENGAAAAAINSVIPKDVLEKIWNEPVTIPFTGDISSLPGAAQDAVQKFRKDSGMEGKLYISVLSQSTKFNLNSYLPTFVAMAKASPSPSASPTPAGGTSGAASPTPTPAAFDQNEARKLLMEQIKNIFQKKFDEDDVFRDRYRNLNQADLVDDIMAWNDLTYESTRMRSARQPYKRAPFYDISELRYLPTVDDEIYDLLAPSYSATVESTINLNKILEPTLVALLPDSTPEERKKFFEDRDTVADPAKASPTPDSAGGATAGGPFKEVSEFYDYVKSKIKAYDSATKIQELKDNLLKRGISLTVDESQFIIHIEATVHQTKKTLEAIVTVIPDKTTNKPKEGANNNPNSGANNPNVDPNPTPKRSSLKVIQMRFL